MSKIKIVTDSSIAMAEGLAEELGISIVSLSFMIDGVVYQDADFAGQDFIDMMVAAKALPKTSQPPIGQFVETYQALVADGSEVISIHMTQALSGTVEAARQASKLVDGKVTVIDSGFTDQALAFQVIEAAKMANDGFDEGAILAKIEEIKAKTRLFIGISNLDNLIKGGRISRLTGMLSSFLNVKVVMELVDDELRPVVKGRGLKTFAKWFDEWQKQTDLTQITAFGISHADGLETAEKFKAEINDKIKNIVILDTASIIATHTGVGAWAVAYY